MKTETGVTKSRSKRQKVQFPRVLVKDVMKVCPITIRDTANLEEASSLMEEYGIRHLPVEEDHCLVGILSDRDIARAKALSMVSAYQHGKILVSDAMTRDPYSITPETPLAEALRIMAANRLGCVLVKGSGERVIGVFTTTDALYLLAELVRADDSEETEEEKS